MDEKELNEILEKHAEYLKTGDLKLRANLCRADLYEANLYGADLRRADLYEADLRRANLYEADLRRANLYGANLREANLCRADLYGANLREANLCRADLYGANLYEANLYGANLYEANLYEANLCRADLREVKGSMAFIGEKHLLIYFKHRGKYYFKIGCMTYDADYWVKNFREIGMKKRYSEGQIQLYGDVIKLFSQYDLLEK